jgi:hypothetical protein
MNPSALVGRSLALAVGLVLRFSVLPAQNRPEVFVQTGHTQQVDRLALSGDQRTLVSKETFGLLKVWDVASTREIRTIKPESGVSNVYFIDNERFLVLMADRADVYSKSGTLINTIKVLPIQSYGEKTITRSGKYLLDSRGYPTGVHFFDMKDGSETKLPEQKIDPSRDAIVDLGNATFGVFYSEYARVKEEKNIGNTGYVILDEDLQVKKRGVLKGIVGIGGKLRIDRTMKFVYELRDFGDKPELTMIGLESGAKVCSYPLEEKRSFHDFAVMPDGGVRIGRLTRSEMVKMEYFVDVDLTVVEFVGNCLVKEKKFALKDLAGPNSYVLGADGCLIASHRDGSIQRHDPSTGKAISRFGVKPVVYSGSSYSDGKVLNLWQDFSATEKEARITFNLWNLKSASLEQFNVVNSTNEVYQKPDPTTGWKLWHLTNPDAFFSRIPREFYPDGSDPRDRDEYDRAIGYPHVYMKSPVAGDFLFTNKENYLAAVRKSDKTEAARMYAFSNGEWIVITPEGYFNASPDGAKLLNVRVGNDVYSIDNFYERFYNPALVASVLQGSKIEAGGADLRKGILPPPEVRIVSPGPGGERSVDTVTILVSAKDAGGGVGEIRLYQNGKAVGGDVRGMKIVPKGNELFRAFTVTLVDGANTFRATALSRDSSESNPYELTVTLAAPRKEVSMYLLAVGINTYKNPALNLNYAVPDAKGIAEFFRKEGRRLFKNVNIGEIYDEQATKASIVSGFGRLQNTNPQDAVVIYLAGHGENINDRWYFIPHELTFPEREVDVMAKGISSEELKESIKMIRAQKILVLIDACKSGAVLVAFRGFEDRKALSQLSRAAGVHVVAASAGNQFAAEVKELGHGVFTYTLLQGLGGKAAGSGESVTVRKLMGYIEEQLPEITKKYKQEAQYPVVDSRGMDFPLTSGK